MKKIIIPFSLALLLGLSQVGCEGASNQTRGTVGGGALGALAGGVAGHNIDGINRRQGAIGGALVGGLIGNQMGRQQDQINRLDAQVNYTQVNVQNSNGSITPVTLTRSGNGWVGPRGEYYPSMPSSHQLHSIYGF